MFILLVLLTLHSPDGYEIQVNPAHITALRPERDVKEHERLYHKNAKCLISLADGKSIAVVEECEVVQEMIDEK